MHDYDTNPKLTSFHWKNNRMVCSLDNRKTCEKKCCLKLVQQLLNAFDIKNIMQLSKVYDPNISYPSAHFEQSSAPLYASAHSHFPVPTSQFPVCFLGSGQSHSVIEKTIICGQTRNFDIINDFFQVMSISSILVRNITYARFCCIWKNALRSVIFIFTLVAIYAFCVVLAFVTRSSS